MRGPLTLEEHEAVSKAPMVPPPTEDQVADLVKYLDAQDDYDGLTGVNDEIINMSADGNYMMEKALSEYEEPVELTPGTEKTAISTEIQDRGRLDLDYICGEGNEEAEESAEPLPALTIDFLDVGMGDSTLFVCGDGTTVLIDCGSTSSSREPGSDAVTFLQARLNQLRDLRRLNEPQIDRLYLTHPDQDHYNLLPSLFSSLPGLKVGEFHIGGRKNDYKMVRNVFPERDTKLPSIMTIFQSSKVVEYDPEFKGEAEASLKSVASSSGRAVSFRTLCANAVPLHKETKRNASSIAVLVEMAGQNRDDPPVKILMMGDGEQTVEEHLLRDHNGPISASTLLHVGHHGAEKAANKSFLEVVDPRVAQISADQNYAHPYRTLSERITKDPALQVNQAMANDPSHSIVVGEGANKTKFHKEEQTNSAIIMNIGKQEVDTSGSVKAEQARREGATPMVAIGQQWRVTFEGDGSFEMFSTLEDQNHDVVYLPNIVSPVAGTMGIDREAIGGESDPHMAAVSGRTRTERRGNCLYEAVNIALNNPPDMDRVLRQMVTDYAIQKPEIMRDAGLDHNRVMNTLSTPGGWAGNEGDIAPVLLASAIRQNIRVIAEGWETVVQSLEETQGDEIRLRLSDNHYDVL